MPHYICGIFIKMISKVNLSTVTFSNEWRQILKSNNKNSKSFISIYLDLLELSNSRTLVYKEHNDSVKNLLSVFNVSDISEIKTEHISLIKENKDFKTAFEKFSKMLFDK